MKTLLCVLALSLAACGGDDSSVGGDASPPDIDAPDAPRSFKQVEQLARPGIAEALLINNDFLGGYNATAPTFAGVPEATLQMVIAEAKTVLKAVYLGACFINGKLLLSPLTGVKPAGGQCHAVGDALFDGSGNLTTESQQAAQDYADKVFGQFIPDVMRVDLNVASSYLNLCSSAAPNVQLLCGGRLLNDDTIDVTYDYLINGAATPKDLPIVSRLVSDGVQFSTTEANNRLNRTSADPGGAQGAQGHPNVSATTFPYSANPL